MTEEATRPVPQSKPDVWLMPRRFRPRTVLFPLLFLGIHWLMINLTAAFYVVVYAFLQSGSINPMDLLADVDLMNKIIQQHYPVISTLYSAALIPFYWLFLAMQNRRDPRSALLDRPEAWQVWPSLAIMVGVLGLTNIWFNLLTLMSNEVPAVDRMLDEYMELAGSFTPDVGYIWLILGISILTPVGEELLFRGIIQGELRKAMPEWAAILIQGVLFALFHMQPVQISYVLLPGILLGLLYAWTRSLWVPITMHIVFNFLGSVLPALAGDDAVLTQIIVISEIAFILIGVICLIYLYKNRKHASQASVRLDSPI